MSVSKCKNIGVIPAYLLAIPRFFQAIMGSGAFLYAIQNYSSSAAWSIWWCGGVCRGGQIVLRGSEGVEETAI
jgi:hypothetical protein